ncbi:protein of unknown function [Limnospira indica PCC 8005]|uniref:Uncharacterized protein n=1 Tax=Limnospira indica PCC 8005 TaxID=376219 RepID=A0A9P1KAR7_9CYAN|nr:protein of unknown function [Limnospira indica PCC 8005]
MTPVTQPALCYRFLKNCQVRITEYFIPANRMAIRAMRSPELWGYLNSNEGDLQCIVDTPGLFRAGSVNSDN